jgi:hypothetical protein
VKDQIIRDPLIDIALPPKPKIRKSFDDVLSGSEVRRLVAAVADSSPGYEGLKTNGRYSAPLTGPSTTSSTSTRVCRRSRQRVRRITWVTGGRTRQWRSWRGVEAMVVPAPFQG